MSKPSKKRTRIPIWRHIRNNAGRKWKMTHCIFDLDGTLINSEQIQQNAIKQILAKYNLDYSPELQACILGRTIEDACKILITDGKVPLTLTKCIRMLENKTSKRLVNYKLMPGVEKLVKHLHKHDVPLAIVTTSTEEEVDLKLSAFGEIRRLFHHEVASGSERMIQNNPPFPDLLVACARRFCTDCEHKKTLVFDDAPVGVRAANAAEMKMVLIQQIELPRCITKCADVLIPTLEQFKPEEFGFPKYLD